jgi:hypothetical protein
MTTKKISELTTIIPVGTDLVVLDRPVIGPGAPVTGKATLLDAVSSVLSVSETWEDGTDRLATTASVAIAGGFGAGYFADNAGSDVFFYVSGSRGTASNNKSVFEGTVLTSGNIQIYTDLSPTSITALQWATSGNIPINGLFLVDASALGFGSRTQVYGSLETTGHVFQSLSDTSPIVANITGSGGYFSGSYDFPQGLSGSLTKLVDGTDYLIAGTNITLTTGSNGAITVDSVGGGLATGKQFIAPYAVTALTSPQAIGQFSWVPSDYSSLSQVELRAILSTDGTVNHTGSLQVFNLTSGSFVDVLDSPISAHLNFTGSNPTLFSSRNLLDPFTNFDNSQTCVYEVRVSGSSGDSVIVGGVELVFS